MAYTISIDVGMRNLAFCILEPVPDQLPRIVHWDVIDLGAELQQGSQDQPVKKDSCSCLMKNGKSCSRKVTHVKIGSRNVDEASCENIGYCTPHAKDACTTSASTTSTTTTGVHIIVPDDLTKLTKKKLIGLCTPDPTTEEIGKPPPSAHKSRWVEYVGARFNGCMIHPIKDPVKKELDMIEKGRAIKSYFDYLFRRREATPFGGTPFFEAHEINTVLIENQIAPHLITGAKPNGFSGFAGAGIQNKLMGTTDMKTIQALLTQYFIMRCPDTTRIISMSSSHKLNQFSRAIWSTHLSAEDMRVITDICAKSLNKKGGELYRCHKQQAKQLTMHLLQTCTVASGDPQWTNWWGEYNKHSKRDDLGDAFLQGLAFIIQ